MKKASRRDWLALGGRALTSGYLAGLMACAKQERKSQAADALPDAAFSQLESRIASLMAELRVPGATIAVIRDAHIIWRKAYGVRDVDAGQPVDHNTVFSAQSMSKPVFAYRVMKLCEQGVLNLDTPLTKYTPDVFVKNDPRLQQITARRVLSHTTGLPNWRSKAEPLHISFTPGEKFHYSGEGYHYLQSVVTRLSGHTDLANCRAFELGYRVCATDFGPSMTRNLLQPFGMASSGYEWTEEMGKNLARAHDAQGRPMALDKATALEVGRYGSAGSLMSTATDYAKFLVEVMDPKPADAFRLNEASRKEMLTPQIELPEAPVKISWALGWQIWHLEKGDVVAHGGDIEGYHSMSAFSPTKKAGFVMMTNGEGGYEMLSKRLFVDLMNLAV